VNEFRIAPARELSHPAAPAISSSATPADRRIRTPVIGFLAFTSGALEGAILRDMRLANALTRRGYRVVVYWMMERIPGLLHPQIAQRFLMRGLRYFPSRPSPMLEAASRVLDLVGHAKRRRFAFHRPKLIERLLRNYLAESLRPAPDPGLTQRLARALEADGVTHLLPTHAMTAPLARAARATARQKFDYLVTFQGEEIFAIYLEDPHNSGPYFRLLRQALAESSWPAIAVSRDYAERLREEIGIDPQRLVSIPPGIEPAAAPSPTQSLEGLRTALPWIEPGLPIVAYFGRQDAEKGIDLLLYASRLLQERGLAHQLVICGSASFGRTYEQTCKQIAGHLRLRVTWAREIGEDLRAALFRNSLCVVYPSIHREPFGMVVPEAMAHGAPVVVPDRGGIAETIATGAKRGGLSFRAWDSGDLADQIERLLKEPELRRSLAADGPGLAAQFTVEILADRLLAHVGLPPRAADESRASR